MPTPVHFEIHAGDPETARTSYGALFGWVFQQFGDMSYWLIRTGGGRGRDGGLLLRGTDAPEAGVVRTGRRRRRPDGPYSFTRPRMLTR
jgi:predicted enzyme related to lactoylglutathione lyase